MVDSWVLSTGSRKPRHAYTCRGPDVIKHTLWEALMERAVVLIGATLAHVAAALESLTVPDSRWQGYRVGRVTYHRENELRTRGTWFMDQGEAFQVAAIEVFELPGETRVVFLDCKNPHGTNFGWERPIGEPFETLADAFVELMNNDVQTKTERGGPRQGTVLLAMKFKAIKEEHPGYSYAKVVSEANRYAKAHEGPTAPVYTVSQVRYAYKVMVWQWERSNTLR
jgi:hypothetical protein